MAKPGRNLSLAGIALVEDEITKRSGMTRFWAEWNVRMDAFAERLEASAERTTALLAEMAAAQVRDAAFIERWNSMTYAEAVAFQRERGL